MATSGVALLAGQQPEECLGKIVFNSYGDDDDDGHCLKIFSLYSAMFSEMQAS